VETMSYKNRKRNATHAGADLEIQVTKGIVYVFGRIRCRLVEGRVPWSSNGISEWRERGVKNHFGMSVLSGGQSISKKSGFSTPISLEPFIDRKVFSTGTSCSPQWRVEVRALPQQESLDEEGYPELQQP